MGVGRGSMEEGERWRMGKDRGVGEEWRVRRARGS